MIGSVSACEQSEERSITTLSGVARHLYEIAQAYAMEDVAQVGVPAIVALGLALASRLGLYILHRGLVHHPDYPQDHRIDHVLGLPTILAVVGWIFVMWPFEEFAGLRITRLAAAIGSTVFLLLRINRFIFRWLFVKFDISGPNNLKRRQIRTQLEFVRRILDLSLVIIGASIALFAFETGREVATTMLASAGVASVVLGFAAQRSLSNLVAGFQIAFTQPIRIDDALVVENEWGWVEEINLTYVVMRLWDRRRLILPINYFIEKPFQNWTRNNAQILGAVHLHVDFSVPLDDLEQCFEQTLANTDLWDGDAKVMQVVEAHQHTVEVRMLMTAADSPTAFDLRCLVRRKCVEFLQEHHPHALPNLRIHEHLSGPGLKTH